MRRDNQRVVVTEYESGTLLLQGRASDLFKEVCVVLDSAFSQSFAKRGARYAPDPERQVLLDHLHRPHTEQRAVQWAAEHLGRRAYAFLSPSDRQTYLSGAGLLLSTRETGLSLSDYSALVMPFARAYEGFLLQLALALGIAPPPKRAGDPASGRAGATLNRLRQAIERAEMDQARARELSAALGRAWREIWH